MRTRNWPQLKGRLCLRIAFLSIHGHVDPKPNTGLVDTGGQVIYVIELAKKLREYGQTIKGRHQLAINAFADALEVIPRVLAENAGLDPIDIITELKAKHESEPTAGLDLSEESNTPIVDVVQAGIVEPTKIKLQAIKSASEVATMILRIDDVIAASSTGEKTSGPNIGETPEY